MPAAKCLIEFVCLLLWLCAVLLCRSHSDPVRLLWACEFAKVLAAIAFVHFHHFMHGGKSDKCRLD